MEDQILAYKGYVLKRYDLDSLKNNSYLTDGIIGFYFSYLESLFGSDEILLLPPSVTLWLTNSEDPLPVKDYAKSWKLEGKQIIAFPIIDDPVDGSHWSLFVYCCLTNAFYHYDTVEGANNISAMKLYDAVKEFVGTSNLASGCKKKKKAASKNKKCKDIISPAANPTPSFVEVNAPQQGNESDCGIYVMAITKAICMWHANDSKDNHWLEAVEENVNASVEYTMRAEVIKVIEDLGRVGGQVT